MLPHYAIHHRTVVLFGVMLIVCGGIFSYFSMGRLEDPEFSIKTAVVVTVYPGASAEEVETQVTDIVERSIQRVSGLKRIRSISYPGISVVFVDIKSSVKSKLLPAVWQNLRNKLSEIKTQLPAEALPPVVKDDFGDVYGIVLALSSDDYTPAELRDKAKELQRELQLVNQVGRVELWGVQKEIIEIEMSRAKMGELSVHPLSIILALQRQNLKSLNGSMTVQGQNIRLAPTGTFLSVDEIADLVLPDSATATILGIGSKALAESTLAIEKPNDASNSAARYCNHSPHLC